MKYLFFKHRNFQRVIALLITVFSLVVFVQKMTKPIQKQNEENAIEFFYRALNCGDKEYFCQITNYTRAIELNPNLVDA